MTDDWVFNWTQLKIAPGSYLHQDESFEEFQQKQRDLQTVIWQILNICILGGHTLHRWKNITNLMIFKESGNFQIHKLRIIHLYEADLNLLFAVKWRQLLKAADQLEAVNVSQFGGRPGQEATTPPLMEELKIDISYLTRRASASMDNDAASCYDRIVAALASLSPGR